MKNYERPMLVKTEQMSEGVYLASGGDGGNDGGTGGGNDGEIGGGSGCYTVTAKIHQWPQLGSPTYKIQVDGKHNADHDDRTRQRLTLVFNKVVKYVSSNGTLVSGDNTCMLVIDYSYKQNYTDDLGLGDVEVSAEDGLQDPTGSITDYLS